MLKKHPLPLQIFGCAPGMDIKINRDTQFKNEITTRIIMKAKC